MNDNITDELMAATDTATTKQLVDVFNMNIQKKAIVRANKYSEVLDDIAAQIEKRIKTVPDQFSNKDLIDYVNTLQKVIDTSTTNTVETVPKIQLTKNEVNVVNMGMDRNSIAKIKDAIQAILDVPEKDRNDIIDVTQFTEIVEN